jgi:hypothetical protein
LEDASGSDWVKGFQWNPEVTEETLPSLDTTRAYGNTKLRALGGDWYLALWPNM